MRTVYFVPFSESGLENKLFKPYFNPKSNVPPFDKLKEFLEAHGIEARTIDYWDKEGRKEEELVIVFDHPPVGVYKVLHRLRDAARRKASFPLKNRDLLNVLPHFKRKVLMQWESPVNNPWVYQNIPSVTTNYDEAYFVPKAENFPRFYYPQNFDRLNETHFNKAERKFMVMMNSASRAKGFWQNELYSKRVEVLEFFGRHGDVDLYGGRWENGPQFIKKIWKGFAEDKPATMSSYTFALCFENAIWPNYVTEKIFDCMAVGTIPIYWGAPDVENDIPADCFINMRRFKGYPELREYLHALAPAGITGYKEAMRKYFASAQFQKFTPQHFFETVLRVIANNTNNGQ